MQPRSPEARAENPLPALQSSATARHRLKLARCPGAAPPKGSDRTDRLVKKRPPDGTWLLLRGSIFLIFDPERQRVRLYQCDEEGILRGVTLAAEGE